MGKNLRGKEIDKGICQRKDGLYCVRYVNKFVKRKRISILKLLQQLLGYASIKTTMDRYVHVTEDSLANAVMQFKNHFS